MTHMGEWKTQVSVRVTRELRLEMEEMSRREHRTLGNLGGILIAWAVGQLREAGSTMKLFNEAVPIPRNSGGNYKRGRASTM